MPSKRPDETQDAFVIRCIRDDEAEACIEAAISAEIQVIGGRHAGDPTRSVGHAVVKAIRARIGDRAQG